MAHEIATPVNTVAGFALALADGAAQAPQQRAEAKALIESQTERLRNLLGDLRELTRLDLAEGVNPCTLALAPFSSGAALMAADCARFLAVTLGLAAACTLLAIVSLRPVVLRPRFPEGKGQDERMIGYLQTSFVPQATPHTPQFAGLLVRSMHSP